MTTATLGGWMDANLAVQGYCLRPEESRALAVGMLFATGYEAAALALGAMLVALCGLVTATNFCVPSALLAAWWRWRGRAATT